ncbi:glycoside hydrolase family 61 protein [Flagelloscypha sp. PMI_526]|nr:glycoside hydrolase family 61 protein [Flagelloscypha sp. PMI_526]
MKVLGLPLLALVVTQVSAHYTFPSLKVGGTTTGAWVNTRKTNNYNSRNPVTDVKSADFRCYTSETQATAATVSVAAGIVTDGTIYHPSVTNVYMAKASNGNATTFAGDGAVQGVPGMTVLNDLLDLNSSFTQITATTDGGNSINFPSNGLASVDFTLPKNLPNGQYLVRVENIALHSASSYGGAQFYIACAQIQVTGGGSGTPGPLVSIPGVYTGNEPGILINIYYPVPATYTQPGPAVWTG